MRDGIATVCQVVVAALVSTSSAIGMKNLEDDCGHRWSPRHSSVGPRIVEGVYSWMRIGKGSDPVLTPPELLGI